MSSEQLYTHQPTPGPALGSFCGSHISVPPAALGSNSPCAPLKDMERSAPPEKQGLHLGVKLGSSGLKFWLRQTRPLHQQGPRLPGTGHICSCSCGVAVRTLYIVLTGGTPNPSLQCAPVLVLALER
jgi:hypothetical protein